jgi:hypothetical protein
MNTIGVASFTFVSLESNRSNSKGFVAWGMLTLILSQLIGICIVIPLLWIPSFFLLNSRNSGFISSDKVTSVFFTSIIIVIGGFLVHYSETFWYGEYMFFFNIIIPLLPLLWKFGLFKNSNLNEQAIYLTFGGICFSSYLATMIPLIVEGNLKQMIYKLVFNLMNSSANGALHFLIIDYIVTCTSWFIFISFKGSFFDGIIYIILSLLIGPGAALFYFLNQNVKDIRNIGEKNK